MRDAQRQAGLSDREPEVLCTRHELALLSENPEAELAEVARLKADISGAEHRNPAESEAALGFELLQQGRTDEARALLQRAGEVFLKMDGPQNESTMTNSLLVAVLSVVDSAARGEELEVRMAEVRRQIRALRQFFGEGSPHSAALDELEELFQSYPPLAPTALDSEPKIALP